MPTLAQLRQELNAANATHHRLAKSQQRKLIQAGSYSNAAAIARELEQAADAATRARLAYEAALNPGQSQHATDCDTQRRSIGFQQQTR